MDREEEVIAAFRRLVDVELQEFINASQQLGEPIFGLANMVKRAFRNLLSFIVDGVCMEKPDEVRFKRMIELLAQEISDIQTFRDKNRQINEVFNHLSTVSESIVALSWISVGTPIQFVHDMRDAGQYFGNRVLSQYKGNQQHQDWINKWNQVLSALENYVKTYHRYGFDWNVCAANRNRNRPDASGSASAPLRQVCSFPPPPPPPPAMDLIPETADDRQNLLRDLNQGVNIVRRSGSIMSSSAEDPNSSPEFSSEFSEHSSTESIIALVDNFAKRIKLDTMLKPVNKQQASQSQQSPSSSGENLPRKPIAERTYPPKLLLDGRKWRVEHQKDRYDLVIDSAEMSHSLAMFKCQNSGLEVRNKLNGVTIDNCKRATVVLRDIISSVELIGCQHVKLQCTGHVPLISIDNCDSVEIYLTDKSLDAEMISSKSSSLNISVMKPDGDYTEMAVPEQIKTVVVNGKLVSTVVEKI